MDDELIKAFQDATRDIADEVLAKAEKNIEDEGISDKGTLAQSGQVVPNAEGGYDVVFAAEHASYIEDGTLAHSVSQAGEKAIREWVARKLKPTPKPGKTQVQTNNEVANAIVWSIRKHGSEPRFFVRKAVDSVVADHS